MMLYQLEEITELKYSNIYVRETPVSSKKLAQLVAASANSNGGHIIFGAGPRGVQFEATGVSKDIQIEELLQKSLKRLDGKVNVEIRWSKTVKGHDVVNFTIKPADKPINLNGTFYIWQDDDIIIAEKGEMLMDNSKVFIVHGRDDLAKVDVARFVEKLGLEAIILHEQASSGKTIIEKIEEHTNVGFGIVLYTPCDVGGLKGETDLKARARQNVVFEHGFLMGKIGRSNVCALVKSDVEKPNDISGVVYIGMDNAGGWQAELMKEMKSSGLEIDANRLYG